MICKPGRGYWSQIYFHLGSTRCLSRHLNLHRFPAENSSYCTEDIPHFKVGWICMYIHIHIHIHMHMHMHIHMHIYYIHIRYLFWYIHHKSQWVVNLTGTQGSYLCLQELSSPRPWQVVQEAAARDSNNFMLNPEDLQVGKVTSGVSPSLGNL